MATAYRSRLVAELHRFALVPAVVLLFAGVLHFSYKLKVAPLYSYQGLSYRSPEPAQYVVAIGLVVLVGVILPHRIRHTSDFILWLLFVMGAAPAILLPQYMNTLEHSDATVLGVVVAGCMIMVRSLARARPHLGRWSSVRVPPEALWTALAAFCVITYAAVIATAGIRLRWVDLAGGYDLRADYATATTGNLVGYALPWVMNVVNPVFIARGIYSRRWLWVGGGAIGQYVIFASTGQKVALLSVPGIILIALLFRYSSRPRGLAIMAGVTAGAIVTLSLDRILGGYAWTSLFVRRFMIVPGALVAGYLAVFNDQPRAWFATVYGGDSPFLIPPSYLVGKLVLGEPRSNANVSLFGDGYVQECYLGIFIEGLVLVLLLWMADAVTRGLPVAVASIVFFVPTIALASGAITAVIATHGFGFALVVSALLPRTGWGGHRLGAKPGPLLGGRVATSEKRSEKVP